MATDPTTAGTAGLPTKHLSGPEVLAFRDAAFREYFDRPAYRSMAERTFGPGVNVELDRMLGQDLAREHTVTLPRPAVEVCRA